ncbi:hypothetical protein BO94DRAFT_583625 [Aspergillus sclerotioniger CBS 115572]|uniref:Uncharacterized protein n=1 Tax=Aspergillus sclerotioniger CBS 115572 TaxID=1450535 RepID=A0A317X0K7_9EURO|nr:hypothetical protein BO94DRAFT_583625 [Aspergillus sclerotioniger CBS 115572]PWY91691.1 hypothetical protein BO94DRAFT_583625 [Aspergillus sclerotioniger CBS 115572]
MFWTSDANARLFIGVLNQMRGKVKLDYEFLADHMGSDCTPCAVEQHIIKLKRQANKLSTSSSKGAESSSNKSTPASTPKKRQADQTPMTPIKKVKKDGTSSAALMIVKEEMKPKVKTEFKEEFMA